MLQRVLDSLTFPQWDVIFLLCGLGQCPARNQEVANFSFTDYRDRLLPSRGKSGVPAIRWGLSAGEAEAADVPCSGLTSLSQVGSVDFPK